MNNCTHAVLSVAVVHPTLLLSALLLQLGKRYEAAVRVCQLNSGPKGSRARNVGNILEKEREIQQHNGALATAS